MRKICGSLKVRLFFQKTCKAYLMNSLNVHLNVLLQIRDCRLELHLRTALVLTFGALLLFKCISKSNKIT